MVENCAAFAQSFIRTFLHDILLFSNLFILFIYFIVYLISVMNFVCERTDNNLKFEV